MSHLLRGTHGPDVVVVVVVVDCVVVIVVVAFGNRHHIIHVKVITESRDKC